MCAGKDELKPHLHYPQTVRYMANDLGEIMEVEPGTILSLAVRSGMQALLQNITTEVVVNKDNMAAAVKLMSLACASQEYFKLMTDQDRQAVDLLHRKFSLGDQSPF